MSIFKLFYTTRKKKINKYKYLIHIIYNIIYMLAKMVGTKIKHIIEYYYRGTNFYTFFVPLTL